MNQLIFKTFKNSDKTLLAEWFASDSIGQKFLPSYTTDDFFNLIDFQKRFFWIVYKESVPIGFFDFEIDSREKGYFAFYIAPSFRNKGFGCQILTQALQLPETRQIKVLEGGVAKDNISSIKILEKLGFRYFGIDKEGILIYQHFI